LLNNHTFSPPIVFQFYLKGVVSIENGSLGLIVFESKIFSVHSNNFQYVVISVPLLHDYSWLPFVWFSHFYYSRGIEKNILNVYECFFVGIW
jgi:hypothetical protein